MKPFTVTLLRLSPFTGAPRLETMVDRFPSRREACRRARYALQDPAYLAATVRNGRKIAATLTP